MTLFGAVLAFPCFPLLSFPALKQLHMFLDIPRAVFTGNVQTHQKKSYDAKTGWAPIRCVIWLSSTICQYLGTLVDSLRRADMQTPTSYVLRTLGVQSSLTDPLGWGTSKQHMKLQQPRNYDFRVSQFDPPKSQSSNDRETTTSPPGHH